ncbi:MAG: DUF2619 domain-containing protein [Bacillota bacterium]
MNKTVLTMALIRAFFGLLGLLGALLMLRYNDVRSAVRINGVIGSIGPLVFLSVSLIGVSGLASSVPLSKLCLVLLGVGLIVLGTK